MIPLITTIAAAFGLALLLGFVAARLKLPPLVGYLLAGIVIGPSTPGFVADVKWSRAPTRTSPAELVCVTSRFIAQGSSGTKRTELEAIRSRRLRPARLAPNASIPGRSHP
jgi:sodium/hydrogen exchanger family protein